VDKNTAQSKAVRVHRVACHSTVSLVSQFNPINPELNPICYMLALLGNHPILRIGRIWFNGIPEYFPLSLQPVINYFIKEF